MIRRPRRSTRTDHRLPYTSLFRSIAEVGCGAGEILVELQKLRPDATFTGFEISPQAFGLCGPKGNEGLNFYHEDITKSAKGGFDALLVIDIFEHVRSEEHTSELQSLMRISYAVFCLKKKNNL